MEDYEAHTYGDRIAGVYDELFGSLTGVGLQRGHRQLPVGDHELQLGWHAAHAGWAEESPALAVTGIHA